MSSQSAKLLAALLLSGAAGTAAATAPTGLLAEAEIDFSSFSVQIFDLNLDDNIKPTLEWGYSNSQAYIATNSFSNIPFSQSEDGLIPNTPISGSAAGTDVLNDGQTARVSGALSSPSSSIHIVEAASFKDGYFTVRGAAAVVFSVNYWVSAFNDNSDNSAYVYASATLEGSATDGDGAFSGFASGTGESAGSRSGLLRVSVVNANGIADGRLYLGSQITMGATPPVPEPSEYLMMLAGLGIVGYAVRRRRQD